MINNVSEQVSQRRGCWMMIILLSSVTAQALIAMTSDCYCYYYSDSYSYSRAEDQVEDQTTALHCARIQPS